MREKGVKLLQAQKLVQYLRECEDVLDWINDKVNCYLSSLCSFGQQVVTGACAGTSVFYLPHSWCLSSG